MRQMRPTKLDQKPTRSNPTRRRHVCECGRKTLYRRPSNGRMASDGQHHLCQQCMRAQVDHNRPVRPKQRPEASWVVSNAVAMESGLRHSAAQNAIDQGGEELLELTRRYASNTTPQLGGRVAESLHALSFNAAAAIQGRPDLAARTTAAMGLPTAPADIVVEKAGAQVVEAQVKFCGRPAATSLAVSQKKYTGMQLVTPAEQRAECIRVNRARGIDALGKRDYADAANRIDDRIRVDGVESEPVTLDEARSAARKPAAAIQRLRRSELIRNAKAGAAIGAGIHGVTSVVRSGLAVHRGEISPSKAAVHVARDTAIGAVDGGAKAVGSTVVRQVAMRAGARSLARSAAPVAIAVTTVDIFKDAGLAMSGRIDGDEFARRSAKNVVQGGTTWVGAEAGAAMGTLICPGLGTIAGGLLGGLAGGLAACFATSFW